MSYPSFYREVKEMAPKALLPKRWATSIARKGLQRLGSGSGSLPHTRGTFSPRNSPDGYAATDDPFPDGTSSMQRDSDMSGIIEARVMANIAVAGTGEIGVTGDINATVPLGSTGIVVSDWVTVDGPSFTWTNTGSATVGLVQLQAR